MGRGPHNAQTARGGRWAWVVVSFVRYAAAYLVAQAVCVSLWWLALATRPDIRGLFRPADSPDLMLLAFWLADLTCVVAGSVFAAVLVLRRDPRRTAALWFTNGAMVYGTLYCLIVTAMSGGEAALGLALMLPATAITLAIARAESK